VDFSWVIAFMVIDGIYAKINILVYQLNPSQLNPEKQSHIGIDYYNPMD